jgi:leucine dehydrogenase
VNQLEIELHPDFDGHESVEFMQNEHLTAIIAVHNTNLGPAAGGCRMFPYACHRDALTDVLRLSKGMTYKSALAGLPLGGGKSVIIGDPARDKTRDLLLAMGDFVDSLGGSYITAEDSGTSVKDIAIIGERTAHVSGVVAGDRFGGDPSPVTALGVFVGIAEAVRYRCKTDLHGIRVAIQGVGNVGYNLAKLLVDAGALVTVADINQENLDRAINTLDVTETPLAEILSAEVDVLAPCALGGAINPDTVRNIRAGIVAGAANNQLSSPQMGSELLDRGILYAPDYVINAGGIIDVYYQRKGERMVSVVEDHVSKIASTLNAIFECSDMERKPTNEVADRLAEAVFKPMKKVA